MVKAMIRILGVILLLSLLFGCVPVKHAAPAQLESEITVKLPEPRQDSAMIAIAVVSPRSDWLGRLENGAFGGRHVST